MSERAGTSTREESEPPETDDRPRVKRKKREWLNCAECRRLKLRCDRKVPCDNCIKRECQDLCPDGAREGKKRVSANDNETRELRKQVDSLVELLGHHGVRLDSRSSMSNEPPRPPAQQEPLPSSYVNTELPPQLNYDQTFQAGSTSMPLPQLGYSSGSSQHVVNDQDRIVQQPFDNNAWTQSPVEQIQDGLVRHSVVSPPNEASHGTLVISASGRSKYLGPSAASEWLKDQEVIEASRPPSPRTANHSGLGSPTRTAGPSTFPFSSVNPAHSSQHLLGCLPPRDEADTLIDSYFRYFGWSYEIIARPTLNAFVEKAYIAKGMSDTIHSRLDVQQLATLFAVLALGASHNLELSPDDQIAEDYCESARNCLVKGNFMTHSTLAGVQTLSLMAHYQLQTDRGRDGDSAWPLWGLAMRIAQAMGLHRDGGKWNLPDEVVEDRRRVFWECRSAEVFQANCFSRPSSIAPEFVDTAFPQTATVFYNLKFELCKISDAVLYSALRVDGTSYETVCELYGRVCAFERRIPYDLRCRTALVSLPSAYPDARVAEAESPALNRRDLRRAFEQHWLALIVSETIVNLNRPYFIKALVERPEDPTRTAHGQAFLSVLERSNVLIQIVCTLYGAFPSVTARHWWCWYHAFNSAVCMGTLLLMSPQNDFAPIALQQIDQVIVAYTSVVQSRTSPRLVQNLRWLLRLRQRAVDRMANAQNEQRDTGPSTGSIDETIELDAGLLGWKTRFIERLGNNSQKATTISTSTPPGISPFNIEKVIQSMPRAVQEHVAGDTLSAPDPNFAAGSNDHLLSSTDQLLHQFWDPTLFLQGASGSDTDLGSNGLWDWLNQSGPTL